LPERSIPVGAQYDWNKRKEKSKILLFVALALIGLPPSCILSRTSM